VAKGTYHRVGARDDLMHLAAWYYGDAAAWSHIYWANVDVYGDDFEKIPAGATVFIPDAETGSITVHLKPPGVLLRAKATWGYPGGPRFMLRLGPNKTAFEVVVAADGSQHILFAFADGSEMMTGPTGVADAAESLGVDENTLSNAAGDGSTAQAAAMTAPPARVRTRPRRHTVTNLLRDAVAEYYGHPYFYFDVLDVNTADDRPGWAAGLPVTMPPRFKRNLVIEAAKWRDRIGRR